MLNDTNDKIRYISFKFFLEKGYEATNIRDICKMVNIKPSSLYFYYKSKQELFFSIYNEIWQQKINFIENVMINSEINLELQIKHFYREIINYHTINLLNEKFLLRYHLFPAEEIINLINYRYKFWINKENEIIISKINEFIEKNAFEYSLKPNEFLPEFKKFIYNQITDMLTYSIKLGTVEQDLLWDKFWNSNMYIKHYIVQ